MGIVSLATAICIITISVYSQIEVYESLLILSLMLIGLILGFSLLRKAYLDK